MTLTKEWLLKTIAELEEERDAIPGAVNEDAAMALAAMKIALASLEAEDSFEPVAFINGAWTLVCYRPLKELGLKIGDKLYAATPAPVVPDAISTRQAISKMEEYAPCDSINVAFKYGWNACHAAMLQGTEPVTTACKLPMQPLAIDAHGTLRFKENLIVRKLLDYATEHGYGLNEIALDEFEAEYQMQLAQLIGYSLSGYGTLSYVTDESYDRAAAAAPQQEAE